MGKLKHVSWISAVGLILVLLMIPLFVMMLNPSDSEENAFQTQDDEETGTIMVSAEVERYRPLFEKYAKKYGVEKLVNILMALTMQESGGRVPDVMQSSESLGLPPNTITDPEQSIDAGVRHFKAVYTSAKGDVDLALQAYNFGGGFITWVQNGKGGKYTLSLAQEFSSMMAGKMGWGRYGDPEYVPHVRRYLKPASKFTGDFQKVMDEALKYQGNPYSWGGSTPQTGFDCSGLTQWTYKQVGISLPRTAQEQFYASKKVAVSEAKAGDLVFFTGTYAGKYITHVGIYLGNGRMYNSNDSGIKYDNLSGYWKKHLVGYGRVADFK